MAAIRKVVTRNTGNHACTSSDVFVALHDLNQALRFTDQVLVIAEGTVRGSGPGDEVITDGMLRDVYGINARIERCSLGTPQVIVDGAV